MCYQIKQTKMDTKVWFCIHATSLKALNIPCSTRIKKVKELENPNAKMMD
jgi:hypothetical protein